MEKVRAPARGARRCAIHVRVRMFVVVSAMGVGRSSHLWISRLRRPDTGVLLARERDVPSQASLHTPGSHIAHRASGSVGGLDALSRLQGAALARTGRAPRLRGRVGRRSKANSDHEAAKGTSEVGLAGWRRRPWAASYRPVREAQSRCGARDPDSLGAVGHGGGCRSHARAERAGGCTWASDR